jgi:hypothetical protein
VVFVTCWSVNYFMSSEQIVQVSSDVPIKGMQEALM